MIGDLYSIENIFTKKKREIKYVELYKSNINLEIVNINYQI